MKDDPLFTGLFIGLSGGALAASVILIGFYVGEAREFQSEAVKRGAAEWVVDQSNGSTTFKWKEVAR